MKWNFKTIVRLRWWGITILAVGLIVALYAVMDAASSPLLTGGDVYADTTTILAALWYVRIWFGMGFLFGLVLANLYIHNADTELWNMENIELTKRIAAYEAELKRRENK